MFFTNCVVDTWNYLQETFVCSHSISIFKLGDFNIDKFVHFD